MRLILLSFIVLMSVSSFPLRPPLHTLPPSSKARIASFSPLRSLKEDSPEAPASAPAQSPSSLLQPSAASDGDDPSASGADPEGLPWWWDAFWSLPFTKPTENGTPVELGDTMRIFKANIEQTYGGMENEDGLPLAEGALDDLTDGTMFIGLQRYYKQCGSPYKLLFGPKSFTVISSAPQAKHVLTTENKRYDKGVLAEILEPIMGQGLIPATPEVWSKRRREIVPAFHKGWLEFLTGQFSYCNRPLIESLEKSARAGEKVEMEEKFCSVALDIIGKSIFNYEFGSVTSESPIVKSVYNTLVHAEHMSMTPFPYWDIPGANAVVPRLRKFNSDLSLLNAELDNLIELAKSSSEPTSLEALEARDYDNVADPSLLRFLVDMRGVDITDKQLRDDLMTMLIAGHETTAAVLTWSLFELTRNPSCMEAIRAEIDQVLGDREPTYEDVKDLKYVRLVIAESLRMYPEPPLLIRRCRTPDSLPVGDTGTKGKVARGTDLFISVYNIHRSPTYWDEPDTFDPMRFTRRRTNPDAEGWEGFDPDKWEGRLYPNEQASDFAYLPFGGGARKCLGDQFALIEATVTLALVLRRFEFEFPEGGRGYEGDASAKDHPVGMRTGATIHTRNGLWMNVKERDI